MPGTCLGFDVAAVRRNGVDNFPNHVLCQVRETVSVPLLGPAAQGKGCRAVMCSFSKLSSGFALHGVQGGQQRRSHRQDAARAEHLARAGDRGRERPGASDCSAKRVSVSRLLS